MHAAWKRMSIAAVGITVLLVVFLFDPVTSSIYPRCTFHSLTGLDCPFCGTSRALHELLHGNFMAALRLNALFTLALPCLAVFGLYQMAARSCGWRGPSIRWGWNGVWLLLGVVLVFGIARNLAVHPFTLMTP